MIARTQPAAAAARVIKITHQIAASFRHATISSPAPDTVTAEPEDQVNYSLAPSGVGYRSAKAIRGKDANAISGRAGPYWGDGLGVSLRRPVA